MGAVTSTLERMVIDVAWTFHEWFYGGASGSVTCSDARPVRKSRRQVRRASRHAPQHQQTTHDTDEEKIALFSREISITSTPVLGQRSTWSSVAHCSQAIGELSSASPPTGLDLPTELQAALFRCTAARNGRLPSVNLSSSPRALRRHLPPVLPPLLPTYQRIARLRVM